MILFDKLSKVILDTIY